LPADPVDAPCHVTGALAGRGVGEVPVRAAPRQAGAGVVDLRLVPAALVPQGERQGWPCGHGCGQAVGAPGQAGQVPGQAGDVTLRGSRSSPITSTMHTTRLLACAYPRAAAKSSAPVALDIRRHVLIVPWASGGQPVGPADHRGGPAMCPIRRLVGVTAPGTSRRGGCGGSGDAERSVVVEVEGVPGRHHHHR
jgi:hypothetical protein